jgi:trimeric autotransporter adhesin
MTAPTQLRSTTRRLIEALLCFGIVCTSANHASAQGSLIVTITSPTPGSTVQGTITVSANTTAFGTLVTAVQFTVDDVNIGVEDTSAPYAISWNTSPVGNGSHLVRAVARDALGLRYTSDPVLITIRNATTRVENTEPSITYTAGDPAGGSVIWYHGSRSRDWSGRTASFNRAAGSRATFAFTGTSVRWIAFRAPWAGIARVYVDGSLVQTVDLYSSTEQTQATVFETTGLPFGAHTLSVEPTGGKNASATDNAVVIDAFEVSPAVSPAVLGTRSEQNSAAVSYAGNWMQGDTSEVWSGGTAAAGRLGAEATFTFSGTSVSWIGLRGPQGGRADVFLDGAYHASVDTSASTEFQGVVFTASSLVPARHTVRVQVVTDAAVVVDGFDVRSRIEETDAAVVYTGTWTREHTDRAWSGTSANTGTGTASLSFGGQARFAFTGTAVTWIGFRGPQAGLARVYVDDVFVRDVNANAGTDAVQVPLFSATDLASGNHSITIESTGGLVVVDAFDVALPAAVPSIARVQETDGSLTFAGPWADGGVFDLWTGQRALYAQAAGASVSLTFTGTGVRWIGQRGFQSAAARVYLDDVWVADVETAAGAQEEFQAAIFRASGLANATHTLRIDALDNRLIVVDAFDIVR